ncbi:MAG: carboxypeptidase regulatory-like domain-containing protein [Candidatus Hydrogenedentes bacterium]|nr:carboxypeptidase regulatory-like domain-containing protein [Candidatus Hydrogenedentota bacterium]
MSAVARLGVALLLALTGCGGGEQVPAPAAATESPAPAVAEPAPPLATDAAKTLMARIQVVDLEGTPLANMAPIVTRQPNAFDPPLATGTLTDAGGRGEVRFELTEKVCIRAWDPELGYFPNNFFEVLPGAAGLEEDLLVVMVRGARLKAQLFDVAGSALAGQTVALMLSHPERGPWWPVEAQTADDGLVDFGPVPAGEYAMHFQAASGQSLEQPVVAVRPGQTTDLGALTLH